MEKMIIFYDDTKPSCCRCAGRFEELEAGVQDIQEISERTP
nr:hypothetical protein [Mediterraneibacter glycyrrhizinilyticus]